MMKVFVVTGANRGIGREIVRQIALKQPSVVVLTARDESHGKQVTKELQEELSQKGSPSKIRFHDLDVTNTNSSHQLASWLKNEFGGVDVLVNNAGYASKSPDVNETVARETIGINYFGTKNVTNSVLPLLNNGGRVINLSSGMGLLGNVYSDSVKSRFLEPQITEEKLDTLANEFINHTKTNTYVKNGWPSSTYRVSKALLNQYTRFLTKKVESDPRKLFFAAVNPGWVKTRMGGDNAILTTEQGADTPVFLATTENLGNFPNGVYWSKRTPADWFQIWW